MDISLKKDFGELISQLEEWGGNKLNVDIWFMALEDMSLSEVVFGVEYLIKYSSIRYKLKPGDLRNAYYEYIPLLRENIAIDKREHKEKLFKWTRNNILWGHMFFGARVFLSKIFYKKEWWLLFNNLLDSWGFYDFEHRSILIKRKSLTDISPSIKRSINWHQIALRNKNEIEVLKEDFIPKDGLSITRLILPGDDYLLQLANKWIILGSEKNCTVAEIEITKQNKNDIIENPKDKIFNPYWEK